MSKNILKFEYDFDFILIGIVCAFRDYRICHELNKKLDLNLERSEDALVEMQSGKEIPFHMFADYSNEPESIQLLANKSGANHLLVELKNVDFFLVIRNPDPARKINEILLVLRASRLVSGVYEIDIGKLKSKDNLYFLV